MDLIFDTHAHYDDKAFDNDREELLEKLPTKGICGVVNAGCDIKSSKLSIELSRKYDYIFAAVGIHPHSAVLEREYLSYIEDMLKGDKIVAIGEIGLDYHYEPESKEVQKEVFEKQIILAQEKGLPIIVHDREAHKDTLDILKKYRPRGVVHCFSGSAEMAMEIVDIGMYIGLGGAVTFKNAKNPVMVASRIPEDRILLETDCPYMTPVPFRGKRCDSSHIEYTAKKIAEIRNVSIDNILEISKRNAEKVFGLERA